MLNGRALLDECVDDAVVPVTNLIERLRLRSLAIN